MINQPALNNPYGIHLSGGSNRDIVIEDNTMHGLQRRLLLVDANGSWSSLRFAGNTLIADADESCLLTHNGPVGAFDYATNHYFSPASPNTWFCIDGVNADMAQWALDAGEVDPSEANGAGIEARNLDSYAALLGFEPTLAAFAEQARMQSRHTHRSELSAPEANAYIRAGYAR